MRKGTLCLNGNGNMWVFKTNETVREMGGVFKFNIAVEVLKNEGWVHEGSNISNREFYFKHIIKEDAHDG